MIYKFALVFAAGLTLTACSPQNFESEPVQVQTPSGVVTCQLYTAALTDWDRSIGRPDTMSVAAADAYCKREGASGRRS